MMDTQLLLGKEREWESECKGLGEWYMELGKVKVQRPWPSRWAGTQARTLPCSLKKVLQPLQRVPAHGVLTLDDKVAVTLQTRPIFIMTSTD